MEFFAVLAGVVVVGVLLWLWRRAGAARREAIREHFTRFGIVAYRRLQRAGGEVSAERFAAEAASIARSEGFVPSGRFRSEMLHWFGTGDLKMFSGSMDNWVKEYAAWGADDPEAWALKMFAHHALWHGRGAGEYYLLPLPLFSSHPPVAATKHSLHDSEFLIKRAVYQAKVLPTLYRDETVDPKSDTRDGVIVSMVRTFTGRSAYQLLLKDMLASDRHAGVGAYQEFLQVLPTLNDRAFAEGLIAYWTPERWNERAARIVLAVRQCMVACTGNMLDDDSDAPDEYIAWAARILLRAMLADDEMQFFGPDPVTAWTSYYSFRCKTSGMAPVAWATLAIQQLNSESFAFSTFAGEGQAAPPAVVTT